MPIFPKPIDLAANYVWTGDHTFDGVVTCNGDFNAVDGSFTGDITLDGSSRITNAGYVRFGGASGSALYIGTQARILHDASGFYPNPDGFGSIGTPTRRFGGANFVDGSFTGNLTSEVGGSYKLYNLGDEGDADTEYLEISSTANVFTLEAKKSGAGVVRDFNINAASGDFSGNITAENLPTSDPGVPGQFYVTSGGALKVSQ